MTTVENEEAGKAMDNLLQEIDNEMSIITEEDAGKNSWKIPFQEIGEDTMDMIISHNTKTNTTIGKESTGNVEGLDKESKPQHEETELPLPAKKSVVFSEGVSFHEWSPNKHLNSSAEEDELLTENNTDESDTDEIPELDTKWKPSRFALNPSLGQEKTQDLLLAQSESELEEDEKDPEVTTEEFQKHTVTELDKKLSLVLDSKINIHKLKQMADDVNFRANDAGQEENNHTFKFTLPPTRPLASGRSFSIEAASLIHFEGLDDEYVEQDDREDVLENGYEEDYINEIVQSPSKIPLTNTVNINNFRTTNAQNEPQTRVSSGSSWGESVTDLTTIQHDRYDLLEYTSDIPKELRRKPSAQKDSFASPLVTNFRNTSQVFSIATTADGYKSAKETPSCPPSISPSNDNHTIFKSEFASIEDLSISIGLPRDEETLKEVHNYVTEADEKTDEKTKECANTTDDILNPDSIKADGSPELPHLPVKLSEDVDSFSNDTILHREVGGIINEPSFQENENDNMEFTDLHDLPEEIVQDSTPASCLSVYTTTLEPLKIKTEEPRPLPSRWGDSSCDVNVFQDDQSMVKEDKPVEEDLSIDCASEIPELASSENRHAHILPPLRAVGSMFVDDPFNDEFDTSGESLDLPKSNKPSNYLSIWHMQEEDIKAVSPSLSANSQFSQCSTTTGTSATTSSGLTSDTNKNNELRSVVKSFKFKPRVISRSKFYYPDNRVEAPDTENDYIIANFENALDPLRRNTVISRRIQENIRNRRVMHPKKWQLANLNTGEVLTEDEPTSSLAKVEKQVHPQEGHLIGSHSKEAHLEATQINENITEIHSSQEVSGKNQTFEVATDDLYPCIADNELGKDFVSFLNTLDHDNKSVLSLRGRKEGVLTIWGDDLDHEWDIESVQKKNASFAAISKLLATEDRENMPVKNVEDPKISENNAAVLKSPIKEVQVGRGLSLKGYEARVAQDDESDMNSVILDSFLDSQENKKEFGSPVKQTHVGSPFKILKARIFDSKGGEDELPDRKNEFSSDCDNIDGRHNVGSKEPLQKCTTPTSLASPSNEGLTNKVIDLPDRGTLYVRLNTVLDLSLKGLKRHNAKFSVEFDNGENVVQTPWTTTSDEKSIDIQKEFEIVLPSDPKSCSTLIITLKCHYERPLSELTEVVEKVPVGKRFLFGKNKFEYKKKFVQKKVKYDEWDYAFAQDGSFGRCEIKLDDMFLNSVMFHEKSISFNLVNEWAREPDFGNLGKGLYELPRKAQSSAGRLSVGACYLERSSALENFPRTLSIARSIAAKFKDQQSITKEGSLLQEGGDVQGRLKRRFFKLRGCNLIGFHEISMEPKVDINLLKVTEVIGPGDVPKEGARNLTDLVLFGGCIHLVFANEEEIVLNSDMKEDTELWYQALRNVVDLNKCHQPWVKQFNERSSWNSL